MVTRSGGDDLHGQLFGNFRNQAAGNADFPGGQDNSYSREVFGGDVGGAWKKDKLFYFLSGEYFKQDSTPRPSSMHPSMFWMEVISAPFHETEGAARLDYKLSAQSRAFYRFTYDNGSDVNAFGGSNYQPLKSRGTAYGNGLGFDSLADRISTAFALHTTATPTTSRTRWRGPIFSIPPPGSA